MSLFYAKFKRNIQQVQVEVTLRRFFLDFSVGNFLLIFKGLNYGRLLGLLECSSLSHSGTHGEDVTKLSVLHPGNSNVLGLGGGGGGIGVWIWREDGCNY